MLCADLSQLPQDQLYPPAGPSLCPWRGGVQQLLKVTQVWISRSSLHQLRRPGGLQSWETWAWIPGAEPRHQLLRAQ